MECQFCGEVKEKGFNEFGEFACARCLTEVAHMMPTTDAVA
jgi:hypothetical protein